MRNLIAGIVCMGALASVLAAAPTPAEAVKKMRVPDGWEVTVIASEPDIRQPVTMSFDDRGRIWVLQYLQYPNPAGLRAVNVDQYLRTTYDRVPEPPPHGPRGADRITVGEDTDGDGRADAFKDFITGLNLASGMAIGHGGVFVAQPPYLLFYPDRNGDDVPDSDPEVLLSGFGMEDAHAFANSLTWGPDGWLYGAHGSTVTAKIRGIEFQQGIWRYHPITREFELFAEGGGNTWGVDFDENGELIAGTNFGEQIGLHQVQGGYYVKGFAKHGPLHNPHAYGYFDHLPFRGFKGGHVTCGGIVYQGGIFPEQFRGTYIAANLLSSAVYWHVLQTNGSSFKGHFGGALLESDDASFRPIDCTIGPDGALYVVDWCDPRASHVDPIDNWDKSNGRIYRVAPKGAGKRPARMNLRRLTSNELADQLTNANDWFRRAARVLLGERRDAKILPRLRQQALQTTNNLLALQSLWGLHVSGGFDDTIAADLLRHPHAPVRGWTIRLLGDARKLSSEIEDPVYSAARGESSPRVRSQAASSAKRLPAPQGLRIVRELIAHDEDITDPHIPLLIWWAIEDKALSHSQGVIRLLSTAADWNRPMMRSHFLERLARRYASETNREAGQHAAWLFTTAQPGDSRDRILLGFDKAWEGKRATDVPELSRAINEAWSADNPSMVRVGLRTGVAAAAQHAIARIASAAAPDSERIRLAETLGQCRIEPAVPALLQLLKASPRLQLAAISALQNYRDPQLGAALVDAYGALSGEARVRARSALASRPEWAGQLVAAVDKGRISATDIGVDLLRQMIRHQDTALTATIEKRWGRVVAQTSAEKTSAINQLKLVLNPSGTTLRFKGDPLAGQKVFSQTCAACHRLFGEGNQLGPDLTGAERRNTEWLLSQTVDPSVFIRPEYVNHNVEMKDGRTLSGLIVEQGEKAVTLLDAQNQRTVLNREEIRQLVPSATSLMPDGLLDALSPEQVRDLFSYLQKQP
jgi:putative membrane-bound dehydrogenase-like protein